MNTLQTIINMAMHAPKEDLSMEAVGALAETIDALHGRISAAEEAKLIGVGAILAKVAIDQIDAGGGPQAMLAAARRARAEMGRPADAAQANGKD